MPLNTRLLLVNLHPIANTLKRSTEQIHLDKILNKGPSLLYKYSQSIVAAKLFCRIGPSEIK